MSHVVLLEFEVKSDAVDAMKSMLRHTVPETRCFPACKAIDVFSPIDAPTCFIFHEEWESREAYEKYLAWRTETGAMDLFGQMLAGAPSARFLGKLDV